MDLTEQSPLGCVLLIGLWGQADDKGVFEWKPRTLKAEIFPGTSCDMPALLDVLVALKFIAKYEVDDRQFGAIRNFGKFQRPKKPNDVHPMPAKWRLYTACEEAKKADSCGFDDMSSGIVPNQFSTSSENAKQMEDGGGREGEEVILKTHTPSPQTPPAREIPVSAISGKSPVSEFEEFWKKYPRKDAIGDARRAFKVARRTVSAARIMAALDVAQWPDNARFIPEAAKWLAAERWMDQGVAVVVSTTSRPAQDPRFAGWEAMDHMHHDRWLKALAAGFPSRHTGHAHYTADERRDEMLDSLRSVAPRVHRFVTATDDQRKVV